MIIREEFIRVLGDKGEILGVTEAKIGTICAIRFNEPINITYSKKDDYKEGQWSFNGYAGGVSERGFFTKNKKAPLAVSIRKNKSGYFISRDRRTFIFSFSLFFSTDEEENDFNKKGFIGKTDTLNNSFKVFFDRLTKYGLNVWQEDDFSFSNFGPEEINKELERMADFWNGRRTVKHT